MRWNHDRKGDTYWADDRPGTWWIVPHYLDRWADVANGSPVTSYVVSYAEPWEDVRDPHTRAATWARAVVRTVDEAILLVESGEIHKIAERVRTWDYNCEPGCCS